MHTINAQTPFNLKAGSSLFVKLQSKSTAPDSRIGSLEGENSRRRLHNVDEATLTVKISSVACWSRFINGRHTEWS